VRFIRDMLDIDVEMLRNKCADLVNFVASPGGHSLTKAQTIEGHDQPRFVERSTFDQATRAAMRPRLKISRLLQ
jgi:hypothetical protein